MIHFIDSNASYLDKAQERNFSQWPILGAELWRSLPEWDQRDTYQKEVKQLEISNDKFWATRLQWM